MAQLAIYLLRDLEVWNLRDLHRSPPLQDTQGDALLGRLQLLLDQVPFETFREEFVYWVHEVAAGGMKPISDSCLKLTGSYYDACSVWVPRYSLRAT
jgi:hypothetical protein